MKLEEIKKVIYLESVYLNSSQGYSRDILKPFTDFFKAYATAVTAMGDNAFDSRYIHYKYPSSFLMQITNNFFYKEDALRKFKEMVDESLSVCTWSTSSLNEKDFKESSIYKARYEPNGVTHGMQGTFIDKDDNLCGAIGTIRKIKKPYTEKDNKHCKILSPYIFYAYMKYRWLSGFDFFNYEDLNDCPTGIIQCDENLKVTAFNSFAEDIFKTKAIELKEKTLLGEEFAREIEKLETISNGEVEDKYFFNNIQSVYAMFPFVSFKTKKNKYKNLLKNRDGYVFIFSIEKNMMDTFLKLTFREQEVLKFLSSGLQDKEIAFKMSIAQKTVQNHLDKIYKKIEVSNRTEAALFASDIGLNKYKIPKSKH